MDVLSLLAEARANGLSVRADGARLVIRGPRQAEPIAKRLIERKGDVLEALRTPIGRVRKAWPWIADSRPYLFRTISDAATDDPRLPGLLEEAAAAYELRKLGGVRVFSKVLNVEVWLAPDEQAAKELEEALSQAGTPGMVLTFEEAHHLGRLVEADARAIFEALVRVQRVMPGSRLRSVEILDA